MKYNNLKAFQKHLSSAAPHHLCRSYLVLVPDDFERARVLDSILAFLPDAPNRLSANQSDLRTCLDSIQNMSLFGESVTVIDEMECFSKSDLKSFVDHLKVASGYVILGARSKVDLLASAVEKEGVVFDLLEEKPWDKEKRIIDQLMMRAQNAAKTMNADAMTLLIERLGVDLALLESEIDKLICYVGDRSFISSDDILAISPMSKTATLWQKAEEVIWEGGGFEATDSNGFHGMIPALKSQLHLGLSLATLIEERRPSDEWGKFLPKIWPKTLEKRSSQAARLGSNYFRKGLEKLFEIELISRSDSTQYTALLDLFRAHLHV